jgi:hypothetical protein
MLAHDLLRPRDAATRRRGESTTSSPRLRVTASPCLPASLSPCLHFLSAVFFTSILLAAACGSKPTDPRTVIPDDALVYLETKDLGKTLEAITGNAKFQQLAKTKPDLSALNGISLSVAVTGFETSEQQVTEEEFVGRITPHFVSVAETNAWGWQTKSFVENQLGEFINEAYGGAVDLEITTRSDGESYAWTSPDGRKAYALQQGSLVFFGNDETAIERCQAVKRGEAASIAAGGKITDGERLASGYVSPQGTGQIANLVSMQLAKSTGEEADVQSFVARVLPEILRNTVKELRWTATRTDEGIEDKFVVVLDDETSRVFAETIIPTENSDASLYGFVPDSAATATRYLIRDPRIAWRSVVLTASKKTDETSGALIAAFSGSLFEPYGIEDAETFLGSVAPQLVTVKLTSETEDAAVIASVRDPVQLRRALAKEIKLSPHGAAENQFGAEIWRSEDGEFAAAFAGNVILVGDAGTVLKCLEAKQNGPDPTAKFTQSDAVAYTVANATAGAGILIGVFTEPKDPNQQVVLSSRTETRFNRTGIERRTISDFGLIGWIIEQLGQD